MPDNIFHHNNGNATESLYTKTKKYQELKRQIKEAISTTTTKSFFGCIQKS